MAASNKKIEKYWGKNKALIAMFLSVWFVFSFGTTWFADELSEIVVFGWPLSFYMAAQGSLLIYLLLIWLYARLMNRLDRFYGFNEGEGK